MSGNKPKTIGAHWHFAWRIVFEIDGMYRLDWAIATPEGELLYAASRPSFEPQKARHALAVAAWFASYAFQPHEVHLTLDVNDVIGSEEEREIKRMAKKLYRATLMLHESSRNAATKHLGKAMSAEDGAMVVRRHWGEITD